MSLEGWESEEEELIVSEHNEEENQMCAELADHIDEEPLEIIDYSCLNTFEMMVQEVETFLSRMLQTHDDLQCLWKEEQHISNDSHTSTQFFMNNTSAVETVQQKEQEESNNTCIFSATTTTTAAAAAAVNNDGGNVSGNNKTNYSEEDKSSSDDSLQTCNSFSSPVSYSCGAEAIMNDKHNIKCSNVKTNKNKVISDESPIIIGKTFRFDTLTSNKQHEMTPPQTYFFTAESINAINVSIHMHDNASPITQLYHLPFFILISNVDALSTYQTSEANYYLSILVTAMSNVLESFTNTLSFRVFAPLRHLCCKSTCISCNSHYGWDEHCVPCFTPIGDAEEGLYLGTTPLYPVNNMSRTQQHNNEFNEAAKSSNKPNEKVEMANESHKDMKYDKYSQENMQSHWELQNVLLQRLITPHIRTSFFTLSHVTLPFDVCDISKLCDVFHLHLGPQSKVCSLAASHYFDESNSSSSNNNSNHTPIATNEGICITVEKSYTLAMPYRFHPVHPEQHAQLLESEILNRINVYNERLSMPAVTPRLSWNEVIKRENNNIKLICGVDSYSFGTQLPPITHLDVHFKWSCLSEEDIDTICIRYNWTNNNNNIYNNNNCNIDEQHGELDPFATHILHIYNNDNLLEKRHHNFTRVEDKCQVTLSTRRLPENKLTYIESNEVYDAWSALLLYLEQLLAHEQEVQEKLKFTPTTITNNNDTNISNGGERNISESQISKRFSYQNKRYTEEQQQQKQKQKQKQKQLCEEATEEYEEWEDEDQQSENCNTQRQETLQYISYESFTSSLKLKKLSETRYNKLVMLMDELLPFPSCNGNNEKGEYVPYEYYDYEAEATLQYFHVKQLWEHEEEREFYDEQEQQEKNEECYKQQSNSARQSKSTRKLKKVSSCNLSRKDVRLAYIPSSLINRLAYMCMKHVRSAEEVFVLWHLCIARLTALTKTCITANTYKQKENVRQSLNSNATAIRNLLSMIGLPELDPPIDLTQSLLVQKLQLLAYCLRLELKESNKCTCIVNSNMYEYDNNNKSNSKTNNNLDGGDKETYNLPFQWRSQKESTVHFATDGWSDNNNDNDSNDDNEHIDMEHDASKTNELRLITHGEILITPPVLPTFPITSDKLLEHALTLQQLHSLAATHIKEDNKNNTEKGISTLSVIDQKWLKKDSLYNDMCLFLYVNHAHNGRVVRFADFIHWHSPRDFTRLENLQNISKNSAEINVSHMKVDSSKESLLEKTNVLATTSKRLESSTTFNQCKIVHSEEQNYKNYDFSDDNPYLSERMQYQENRNSGNSNHVWWLLWQRAKPCSMKELMRRAFNPKTEINDICEWLQTSLEESDVLMEILKATIANTLHPLLCHRFCECKNKFSSQRIEQILQQEHNTKNNNEKRYSLSEFIRHEVQEITAQVHSLNALQSDNSQIAVQLHVTSEVYSCECVMEAQKIISTFVYIWDKICEINYALCHALAVRCILGDEKIFTNHVTEQQVDVNRDKEWSESQRQVSKLNKMETEHFIEQLSSVKIDNECDQPLQFAKCQVNLLMWANKIAPQFITHNDKKMQHMKVVMTCHAERPLSTKACWQLMNVEYDKENINMYFALSQEIR